jgi:hypothetical protein
MLYSVSHREALLRIFQRYWARWPDGSAWSHRVPVETVGASLGRWRRGALLGGVERGEYGS